MWQKILIYLAIAAAIAFASFSSGWTVKGWKDQKDLVVLQTQQIQEIGQANEELAKQAKDARANDNLLIQKVNEQNSKTDDSIATLLTSLRGQSDEIGKVQIAIRAFSGGKCSFGPDADSLFQRAYQAAYYGAEYPDPNSAAASGKATGSHAANALPAAAAKLRRIIPAAAGRPSHHAVQPNHR